MDKRRHIALAIPHTDRTLEMDFQTLSAGLVIHTHRMWLEDVSGEAERLMVSEEFPKALKSLQDAGPYSCAVFGCTSASVAQGRKGMERIEAEMSRVLSCPAISAFGTVLRQIERMQAKTIAVLTPYIDEVNQFFQEAMEQFDVEVSFINGMGLLRDQEIAAVQPEEILAFAQREKACIPSTAELCFFSCTNFRAAEICKELSQVLGMPVITTNQCIIDHVSRAD